MNNKKLIVLEGISGAGKSTNIQIIKDNNSNIDGINIKLSKVMENVEKNNYVDYTNTKYFLILENLKTVIYEDSPKEYVLFERYYLSSLAHSYAMSIMNKDQKIYKDVLEWYTESIGKNIIKPYAYIFLNIPIDVSVQRIKQRNETIVNDIWIKEQYMQLCEDYKRYFVKEVEKDVKVYNVDATRNINEVSEEILKIIKNVNEEEV